ncbi:MAG: N-acetylmuramoyl-L-alanine amidase [Desulfobacterales bacterium]|nr:N-acetylmuramoyl-L-alanine amidase [Desulfobacterales bacterium]
MPKEFIQVFLAIAFLFLTAPVTGHSTTIITGQPRVVLDPGHDGRDSGITSPSGIKEHIITLELAAQIAAELDDTAQVSITHSEDNALTIPERTALANQTRANLFITLHTHDHTQGESYIFFREKSGTTTGITSETMAGSKQLAELTAARLRAETDMKPHVRPAPVAGLEGLLMPGILVEAFSLNRVPEQPGKRSEFLAPFARAVAAAVMAYFETPPADPAGSVE